MVSGSQLNTSKMETFSSESWHYLRIYNKWKKQPHVSRASDSLITWKKWTRQWNSTCPMQQPPKKSPSTALLASKLGNPPGLARINIWMMCKISATCMLSIAHSALFAGPHSVSTDESSPLVWQVWAEAMGSLTELRNRQRFTYRTAAKT